MFFQVYLTDTQVTYACFFNHFVEKEMFSWKRIQIHATSLTRPQKLLIYTLNRMENLWAETDMHAVAIIDLRQRFDGFFADNPDTYVSGTLMMYDVEGPGRTAVSPDILVSFGIGKKLRRTYKVWEEGKPPDFVMEFSSKGTFQNDLGHKKAHYASMGIPEYFLCDIDRRYLPTPLMGVSSQRGNL